MMEPDFSKDSRGLLPAIVQDAQDGRVLMMAYMNREAWQQTRDSGRVTFYSRSRERLWTKGETSGHFLRLVALQTDCDRDTILVQARPEGPVCHTGAETCFSQEPTGFRPSFLPQLEAVIAQRKAEPSEVSYTSGLFAAGIPRLAQKLGEEAVELLLQAQDPDKERFTAEAADLLFHYLALLQSRGLRIADVEAELRRRHRG